MSTSEGAQYIGGYHDACGDIVSILGDVQYIGGYHEYIGDIMSTLGDTISTLGGYHDACGGAS